MTSNGRSFSIFTTVLCALNLGLTKDLHSSIKEVVVPNVSAAVHNHTGNSTSRTSDKDTENAVTEEDYNEDRNEIEWMRLGELVRKHMETVRFDNKSWEEYNKGSNRTPGGAAELYDDYMNLNVHRKTGEANMSCWACSSLVVHLCDRLQLHGLPKSWEDELWQGCFSGYCGYYDWKLNYGDGPTIVQRECIEGDPSTFCEVKEAILRLMNTTVFGNCSICEGHLCNAQVPVLSLARKSYFHLLLITFNILLYT